MRISFIIAGLLLAGIGIFALQYLVGDDDSVVEQLPPPEPLVSPEAELERPDATPVTPTAADVPIDQPPEPEPEVLLPALDDSDQFVSGLLIDSSIPETWLARGDLLRRLAVVLDNGARGTYPRRQLRFMSPPGKFGVLSQGESLFVDPANYQRFDPYLEILASVPPARMAELLALITPLADQALAELGNRQGALSQLDSTLQQILAVPVVRNHIELVQPKVFYQYADPSLEALTPLQKQVLRTGPDNVERLQAYVRELIILLR